MKFGDVQIRVGEYLNANHLDSMLPFFIQQGQNLLEKRLRPVALHTVHMVTAGTPPVSVMPALAQGDASFAVPSDYLETVSISLIEGTTRHKPMDRKDWTEMVLPADTTAQDRPTSFSRRGSLFILNAAANTAYSVENVYCAKATALDAKKDSNYWTEQKGELLILASLYKAIPYLGDDPRAEGWKLSLREGLMEELEDIRAEGMSGTQARFIEDAEDF